MIDKVIKYGQSFATNAEFCEMNKGFTETLKKK